MRLRVEEQRRETERLARQLSEQSRQQWQKAIEGWVALPTAIAVGFAASALYVVNFVAAGLEVFQRTAEEAQRDWRETRPQPPGEKERTVEPPRA